MEKQILRCDSCLSGYFEGKNHECKTYVYNELDCYEDGYLIDTCIRCNCDIVLKDAIN